MRLGTLERMSRMRWILISLDMMIFEGGIVKWHERVVERRSVYLEGGSN